MKEISEDQLWEAAEGRLTGHEKSALEEWLTADARNRRRWETVRKLSGALRSMKPDEPSMRFTARVMEAWDRELALNTGPLQTRTDKRIVFAVSAVLGLLLLLTVGLLMTTFALGGEVSGGSMPGGGLAGKALLDGSRLSAVVGSLEGTIAGAGSYFAGFCLLLSMVLVERYLHSRNYIRNIRSAE